MTGCSGARRESELTTQLRVLYETNSSRSDIQQLPWGAATRGAAGTGMRLVGISTTFMSSAGT